MQWEYHQELCQVADLLECCNHRGSDGWELAGLLPVKATPQIANVQQSMGAALLIFKRQIKAANPIHTKAANGDHEFAHG